ncbi:MAG: hypothetical protein E7551_09515 [Ruminococcaceae bacterium]|nr:hypothetical protein [Oscillospiraceae bacterium]
MPDRCKKCGSKLSMDEIGLYKKMVSRMAEEFLCKDCLAEHFKCSVDYLNKKITQFKAQGCLLFDLDE